MRGLQNTATTTCMERSCDLVNVGRYWAVATGVSTLQIREEPHLSEITYWQGVHETSREETVTKATANSQQ
jgi:hypothetical protein